jgi:hypothetical protein
VGRGKGGEVGRERERERLREERDSIKDVKGHGCPMFNQVEKNKAISKTEVYDRNVQTNLSIFVC